MISRDIDSTTDKLHSRAPATKFRSASGKRNSPDDTGIASAFPSLANPKMSRLHGDGLTGAEWNGTNERVKAIRCQSQQTACRGEKGPAER